MRCVKVIPAITTVIGLAAGCAPEASLELSSGREVPQALIQAVSAGGSRRAIVLIGEPGPMGYATAETLDRGDAGARFERIAALSANVRAALDADDLEGAQVFEHLPMMVLDVDDVETFGRLAASSNVLAVYEDEIVHPSDAESLPLIGQPAAFAGGATGQGTAVAVLDTGTDYTRTAFGSCSAPGNPGCKVVFAQDFAPNDGALDDNGHGTNVSGIVLGVAPNTQIVDMDVFRANGAGYSSDIIAAIDWVIANRATYNIVAMNLSLGGGQYTTQCSNSVFAVPLANARAAGVLPVVASGNDGWSDAMSSPACAPAAVSVGAVYDTNYPGFGYSACTDIGPVADQVTCFSNSNSGLTMLAPGAMITAAGITMGGTSQATPHVAGAVAALKSNRPFETIEQALSRILDAGVPITDARNGLVRPRLDLAAAATLVAGDTTAPTGSVEIQGGSYANTSMVTLNLTATDNVAVTEVCLSNETSACSAWLPFAATRDWALAGTQGTSTVYARYRDASGNESSVSSDSIILDTLPPSDGVLNVSSASGAHDLRWSGFTDGGSGIASYVLVHAAGASPRSCREGAVLYTGSATAFSHSGRVESQEDGYRVCAVDPAGNMSSGAPVVAILAPQPSAPEGTIAVDGGTGWVTSVNVNINVNATDPDGISAACVSNTPSCRSWRIYTPSMKHTLAGTVGPQTVYVWLRDGLGNATASPLTDTVQIDATGPSDGSVQAAGDNGAVVLSWSGFEDPESGVATYRVMSHGNRLIPYSCRHGSAVYEGTDTSATITGLDNGSTYGFRVCAVNPAGVSSPGVGLTALPRLESDAPSASVTIDNGTGWVTSSEVSVNVIATDVSGVSAACLSNTPSCSSWRLFSSSMRHTLADTSGVQTVYVWLRDGLGNETSSPLSASVQFDSTAPTDGTATAAGDNGKIILTWSGFEDRQSGLASYRVMSHGSRTIPYSCRHGSAVYEGTSTTATVTGLTNGSTYGFRVCAINGAGVTSAGVTVSGAARLENAAPTVSSVQINDGSGWTTTTSVNVNVSATDASGVSAACVSNTPSCSTWRLFSPSMKHVLSGSSGPQTVYVWLRDGLGNESASPYTASVQIDATGPSDGTVESSGADGAVTLSWSGFADAESGVSGYRVMSHGSGAVPFSCRHGSAVYQGTGASATITGLTNGNRYGFRVCAVNAAGVASAGVGLTAVPRLEDDAPTGTVQLNDGSGWTTSSQVFVNVTATDASGVSAACVSNTTSCSAWRIYTPSMKHQLADTTGTQTVYVWLRDTLGNTTASPLSASIQFDNSAPTDGTVDARGENGSVVLSWSGFADAESGVSRYRVVAYGNAVVPYSCRHGVAVYEGSEVTTTITGRVNGITYGYRVCAFNAAGVLSAGVGVSATVRLEADAPTGTVQIDSGSGWATGTTVFVNVTATDVSGVSAACVSNTSSCTSWRIYTPSMKHVLAGTTGVQTVYVWLRDGLGNVTPTPLTANVQVDATGPSNGTASATSHAGGAVSLSWSDFVDAESGVTGYRVMSHGSNVIPYSCRHGTAVYEGTDTSAVVSGLTGGQSHAFRVCAVNAAGLLSDGLAIRATAGN